MYASRIVQTRIDEISPDVFRLSTLVPEANLQFNQFLVRDDEPLLFHTGMKALFPLVQEAVAKLVAPSSLRWVGFSHFEQDECGSLNEWLTVAPGAQPVCNLVSAMINIGDLTGRPVQPLQDGQEFSTGKYRFRMVSTPHVPHGWDASLLFETTSRVLFCSDLFTHSGDHPALSPDLREVAHEELAGEAAHPFGISMAYNEASDATLQRLVGLQPRTLAVMHGASFSGDGGAQLEGLRRSLREVYG